MSYIDGNLKLNQINIPGTHDSGTHEIGTLWTVASSLRLPLYEPLEYFTAQTQIMDIEEQLESGIRYFDIRMDIHKNKIRIVHGVLPCVNYQNIIPDYLYLTDVINICVKFFTKTGS